MNNIKTSFSIKDLENLSGVKAHTIRIWEKRYNLFNPDRSDTNIRNYELNDLQKLLNISFLNKNGYKISKIANLTSEEIPSLVNSLSTENTDTVLALDSFKIAMINFDQNLFHDTFDEISKSSTFTEIFEGIFMPLLYEIGFLWQTGTITPANEHFISSLIEQKLQINIDDARTKRNGNHKRSYVLYLPLNEIHDLGLKYINYVLLNKGLQTIYLGQSIPLDSLIDIHSKFDDIVYISYLTIKPDAELLNDYLLNFQKEFIKGTNNELWVLGNRINSIKSKSLPDKVIKFNAISDIRKSIESLKI